MYRVLIVDDESAERDGLEYLIKQQAFSFQIDKACNGQEAFERLQKQPADLLITDIKMPFMNGLELSEKIKELFPDLIILISSAYDDYEYMHKAIKVKVDDYILKPVIVDRFIKIMKNVVAMLDDIKQRNKKTGAQEASFVSVADNIGEKRAIAAAVSFIEHNYYKDIGLESVAQQVYLSPGYISGLFKKETGKSVIQYITLCRLENAKKLLVETNMKIVDVCQEVGYNNSSYFCLLFRKYFGVTPNHLRESGNHP